MRQHDALVISHFAAPLSTIQDIFASPPILSTLLFRTLHASSKLSVNTIPSTVKCIKICNCFGDDFDHNIGFSDLLIDRLEFQYNETLTEKIIHPGILPKVLKELQFGYRKASLCSAIFTRISS